MRKRTLPFICCSWLLGQLPLVGQSLTSIGVPPRHPNIPAAGPNTPELYTILRETSSNGATLVGRHRDNPWKWENGVFEYLLPLTGDSRLDTGLVSISGDGQTFIAKDRLIRNGEVVATFPGGQLQYDLSSDGLTVAGWQVDGSVPGNRKVFLWSNGSYEFLPDVPDDDFTETLQYIFCSGDASIVVGNDRGRHAFRWENGAVERLAPPSHRWDWAHAWAISEDGRVIVGERGLGFGPENDETAHPGEAVRWVDGELEILGVPEGAQYAYAHAVSGDGSIILGTIVDSNWVDEPFIWTQETGMVSPSDYFRDEFGIDISDWSFDSADVISSDGKVMYGKGWDPDGNNVVWRFSECIEVNVVGDEEDADPNDGVIDTDLVELGAQVTLRAAINAANETAGEDSIVFDIPGVGMPEIVTETPLPTITDTLMIDGTTQPGSGRVHIKPMDVSVPDGLKSTASETCLSGLVITGFPGTAVEITGGQGHIVENCLIGTDPSGSAGLGNGIGIKLTDCSDTRVGAILDGLRNIISSNETGIEATNTSELRILGNLIGTSPDGSSPLPNSEVGISSSLSQVLTIGTPETKTIINAKVGVLLKQASAGLTTAAGALMQNLHFNLDALGTGPLGTTMETGLCVEDSSEVEIGGAGLASGARNAFGPISGNAIELLGSEKVGIRSNTIGTTADGLLGLANLGTGIFAEDCKALTVGGKDELLVMQARVAVHARKLEAVAGVLDAKSATFRNMLINLSADGATPLGDTMETGICIEESSGVEIGGAGLDSGESNAFGPITGNAIELLLSKKVGIRSNTIGTTADGLLGLANLGTGIFAEDCKALTVGGKDELLVMQARVAVHARKLEAVAGVLDAKSATFRNMLINLSADGATPLGDTMETGICIEESSEVEIGGAGPDSGESNAFGPVTGNAIELLLSEKIGICSNTIGTTADGLLGLANLGTGIFAEDCKALTVGGKDELLVMQARVAVHARKLEALEGVLDAKSATFRNMLINLSADGATPLGDTMETGICIEESSEVEIGGAGPDSGESNAFGPVTGNAIELLLSEKIGICSNTIGTTADGLLGLANLGTGIFAEDCKALTVGGKDELLVMQARVAVHARKLEALEGVLDAKSATFRNMLINLSADGATPLGDTMETGICIEESSEVEIGGAGLDSGESNAFGPITGNAIELLLSDEIGIRSNTIGTTADGLSSLFNSGTGIFAAGCKGLTVGGPDAPVVIDAGIGAMFKNLSKADPDDEESASIENTFFNLKADGTDALSQNMQTGLCVENSEDVRIGGFGSLFSKVSNNFGPVLGNAIELLLSRDIKVMSTSIGTLLGGGSSLNNQGTGIFADGCKGLTVGGPDAPVVINAGIGAMFKNLSKVDPSDEESASIENTFFNLKADGTDALSQNMETGLCVENSEDVRIGGISGAIAKKVSNHFGLIIGNAIEVLASQNIEASENLVGKSVDGLRSLPIGGDGVFIDETSSDIVIRDNQIHNATTGVNVQSNTAQVSIRRNRLVKNDKAIHRMLHPGGASIASATRGSTIVEGSVSGLAGETMEIDFYAYDPTAPATEADIYLGSTTITLDGGGFGAYNEIFETTAPRNWKITSTATNDLLGTSELSTAATIALPQDTDGDGLPDFWEDLFPECLDKNQPGSPDDDCDLDGRSDLEEYAAGTDPTVPDEIQLGIASSAGESTITIPVLPGRRYTLERSESLTDTSWTPFWSEYVANAATISVIDPSTSDRAFYRFIIEIE